VWLRLAVLVLNSIKVSMVFIRLVRLLDVLWHLRGEYNRGVSLRWVRIWAAVCGWCHSWPI